MTISAEKKVPVRNLCGWDLYFGNIESNGSVRLPSEGIRRVLFGEVMAQVNDNNIMFVGTDGIGSHARIYVEDKEARVELGFETDGSKDVQNVLTADKVKKLLEYKTQKTFEKHVTEEVVTRAEKMFMIEESQRQKLNEYSKIKFLEDYTGFKYD
ncbi:hypothetical protein JOC34_000452 [Virgibacillus halotolerans]|uniref:hypothetical protein n=1 Tax=Virgibacillus halotolerans TaxID=1071053 RepID=UPI00195F32E5|nr:hypothetical protein [Virgibacillus halotolerans]MBM7598095.1 hypothetical protein [Virgibacillus halotolerans]